MLDSGSGKFQGFEAPKTTLAVRIDSNNFKISEDDFRVVYNCMVYLG